MTAASLEATLSLDTTLVVSGAEKARSAFASASARMRSDADSLTKSFSGVTSEAQRFEQQQQALQRSARQSAALMQQFGYQIGDVAVQIAGGTSALVAFTQQGSQLAGAFGPLGAVIGAVGAAIGAAAIFYEKFNAEAEKSPDFLKAFSDNLDLAAQRALEYKGVLDKARDSTLSLFQASAGIQKEVLGDKSKALSEKLGSSLRDKLIEDVNARAKTGEFNQGENAVTPGAGIRARQEALEKANKAADDLTKAASEGNLAALDDTIKKYGVISKETAEIVNQLREAASEVKGINEGLDPFSNYGQKNALRVQAEQLPPDYDRMRPRAPVPGSKNDEAQADYIDKLAQDQKAAADKAKREADRQAKEAQAKADKAKREAEQTAHAFDVMIDGLAVKGNAAIQDRFLKLAEEIRKLQGDLATETIKNGELMGTATKGAADAQDRLNYLTEHGISATTALGREYLDIAGKVDKIRVANEELEKQNKEAERRAKRLEEILVEPWKNLAVESSQIVKGIFDDYIETGKISAGKVFGGVNDLLQNTATGTLSNLATMPLMEAVNTFQEGIRTALKDGTLASFDKTVQESPGLAGGGFGYMAGTAYDLARGKQTYAGVGGAVGGAAGAIVGSYFGPVGTYVGGAVGATAGSFIGGLFGAGGGLGNDKSAQSYTTSSGGIAYSDSSFSEGNRRITAGALGQVGQLQESLSSLGVQFKNIVIEASAGNESGYELNGKKYADEASFTTAALKKLLSASYGVDGTEKTVLANTKAKNAQGVVSDFQFAKEYDKLVGNTTDYDNTFRSLNDQFKEAIRRAKELGLNTEKLAQAQKKANEELEQQRQKDIRTNLNQQKGIERQIGQQGGNVQDFFQNLIDPLQAAGQNSDLSPLAQISKAREEFKKNLLLAQGGDVKGIQALGQSASTLDNLRRQYLGSAGLGAEIQKEITAGTGGVVQSLQEQQLEALKQFPDVQRETTQTIVDAYVEQTQLLRDDLDTLARELKQLQRTK